MKSGTGAAIRLDDWCSRVTDRERIANLTGSSGDLPFNNRRFHSTYTLNGTGSRREADSALMAAGGTYLTVGCAASQIQAGIDAGKFRCVGEKSTGDSTFIKFSNKQNRLFWFIQPHFGRGGLPGFTGANLAETPNVSDAAKAMLLIEDQDCFRRGESPFLLHALNTH